MIQLPENMSNKQLIARIDQLEAYYDKLLTAIHKNRNHATQDTLFRKRELALQMYSDAMLEAAYRKLVTIH